MDKRLIIENSINETNSAKASEDTSQANKNDKQSNKKKLLIIGGISLLITIIVIATILILKLALGDSEDNLEIKGEIKCIYEVEDLSNIKFLGDDFKKVTNFDIYIDGTKIKYSKEYQFNNLGEHEIKFIIYDDVYMDYMFKDISSIIYLNMTSTKNTKIIYYKNINYI